MRVPGSAPGDIDGDGGGPAAYLGTGSCNVIGVDWGALCPGPLYFASRAHVPTAGNRVGEMLTVMVQGGLVDVDNLHVIGHSLGAHVAGLASKKLFRDTGKRPKRITGRCPYYSACHGYREGGVKSMSSFHEPIDLTIVRNPVFIVVLNLVLTVVCFVWN